MMVTTIVLSSVVVKANECTAPKQPTLSGAFCGRVFDATGAAVPNVGLRVVGASDRVVANVQANSKGDFMFPELAKGKYRLTVTSPGWLIEFGGFQIKNPRARCMHPVTVRLDIACCCYGSGIAKKRPPHY
jgi:hypothetical protein